MIQEDGDIAVFSIWTPMVRHTKAKAIFVGDAGDIALRKVWPGVQNLGLEGDWPDATEAVDWAIKCSDVARSKRELRQVDGDLETRLSELARLGPKGPRIGQLTVEGLAEFKGLGNLRVLELRTHDGLDDEEMAALPALPHLKHITLVHCAGLGDGTLHWLSQCQRLRTVRLWNAGRFTARAIGQLLVCPTMSVLDIGVNCGLDALELIRLGEVVPDVKVIVRKETPFFSRLAMSFADAAKAKPLPHERYAWNNLLWRRSLDQ